MTEVYVSVPNGEDKVDIYEQNAVARKKLLGCFSLLLKCTGVDETYSLLKKETRKYCIPWISTPIAFLALGFLLYKTGVSFSKISNMFSWEWSEAVIVFLLALHAAVSAGCIMAWTRRLFFRQFHEAWAEAVAAGKTDCTPTASPLSRGMVIFATFLILLFAGSSIAGSAKYAIYHGPRMVPDHNSSAPLLTEIYSGSAAASLWAALLSSLAFIVLAILHSATTRLIASFNHDLKEASTTGALALRLDSFARRQSSVLRVVKLLAKNISPFATISAKASTFINAVAFFDTFFYKEDLAPLSHLSVIIWTIQSIAMQVCTFIFPANVQKELNKSVDILIADESLSKADQTTTQLAQSMVNRARANSNRVILFNCIPLTQWSGNGLMTLAPLLGLVMIAINGLR